MIIYFKQFQLYNIFIYHINTFTTYPTLLFNINSVTTIKNGVCLYVKVGRENQNLDFENQNVCPESSCLDALELHKRGSWVRQSTIVCHEFYARHITCSEWTFIYRIKYYMTFAIISNIHTSTFWIETISAYQISTTYDGTQQFPVSHFYFQNRILFGSN